MMSRQHVHLRRDLQCLPTNHFCNNCYYHLHKPYWFSYFMKSTAHLLSLSLFSSLSLSFYLFYSHKYIFIYVFACILLYCVSNSNRSVSTVTLAIWYCGQKLLLLAIGVVWYFSPFKIFRLFGHFSSVMCMKYIQFLIFWQWVICKPVVIDATKISIALISMVNSIWKLRPNFVRKKNILLNVFFVIKWTVYSLYKIFINQ